MRVAFLHQEYYPVLEPDFDLSGWGESDAREVDQELLDRWAKAKAEFEAVQERFMEIDE